LVIGHLDFYWKLGIIKSLFSVSLVIFMQLHNLNPKNKSKKKKRVGRGGKRGTFSGKGIKGQKSRAGAKIRPAIRDFIKKIPKLRGTVGKVKKRRGSIPSRYRRKPAIVNLWILNKKFNNNERVTPQSLTERNLIDKIKGELPQIKLLGKGDISKKLLVENCQVSKSAKEKIEKAGGTIKNLKI